MSATPASKVWIGGAAAASEALGCDRGVISTPVPSKSVFPTHPAVRPPGTSSGCPWVDLLTNEPLPGGSGIVDNEVPYVTCVPKRLMPAPHRYSVTSEYVPNCSLRAPASVRGYPIIEAGRLPTTPADGNELPPAWLCPEARLPVGVSTSCRATRHHTVRAGNLDPR